MARKPSNKRGETITPTEAQNARPSDIHQSEIDDLYAEAELWLEPGFKIKTEAQAEGIKKLRDMARKARDAADADKDVEKRPHLDANKEIEARYKPIITKAQRIVDGCNAMMTIWNRALEEKQRREAEETRRAAEEAAQRAAQAAAAAKGDLGAMEVAESAIEEAKRLQRAANRQERDAGKGTGLREVWEVEIVDRKAALYHYLAQRPDDFVTLLNSLAYADVRAGVRSIPGFTITSRKENR